MTGNVLEDFSLQAKTLGLARPDSSEIGKSHKNSVHAVKRDAVMIYLHTVMLTKWFLNLCNELEDLISSN